MIAPLAIVQARIGSTRLPRKMLLPLAGKPLIWHAVNAAVEAFGGAVVAIPDTEENDELEAAIVDCTDEEVEIFRWRGPEWDVLGRFHACAHQYRWHPDSVIVRVTPDDPFKLPHLMVQVAMGERQPVEESCEAFTLRMLDEAQKREPYEVEVDDDDCVDGLDPVGAVKWVPNPAREHITLALFPSQIPTKLGKFWTVDTWDDYEAAVEEMQIRKQLRAAVILGHT